MIITAESGNNSNLLTEQYCILLCKIYLTRTIHVVVPYYLVFYNIVMYIVLYFISCFPVKGRSVTLPRVKSVS